MTEKSSLEEQIDIVIVQTEGKIKGPTINDIIDGLIKNDIIEDESKVDKETGDIITKKPSYLITGKLDDYIIEQPGKPDKDGYFTKTSTIDGSEAGPNNPTIPSGFKPMEPDENNEADWGDGSKAPTEENVNKGLVITDGVSEFVWVPVPNAIWDETTVPSNTYTPMATTQGAEVGPDISKTYYRGMLYNFDETAKTSTYQPEYKPGKISYREPDTLAGLGFDRNITYLGMIRGILTEEASGYVDIDAFKETMQEDYRKMVESVRKFGGFYVGRYETSLDSSGVVKSEGGVMPANPKDTQGNADMWYGFYARQKAYNTESVQGSMIWGSQWDAMLNWMLKGEEASKVFEETNGNHQGNSIGAVKTGTYNKNGVYDKINNVYDLEGNLYEWTLAAYGNGYRDSRGGMYLSSDAPGVRSNGNGSPNDRSTHYGSRITLYVNL